MDKATFSVSVIIPTRNGAETLPELLAMLSQQTIELDDIHVIDSSSEDQTVSIAEQYGAHVTIIPKEEFDHGGTRSMMAQRTSGDIVLYFTQDAIPATRDCVERLLAPFYEDPDIAVSYGRQLPNFDADYSARQLRLFNYPDISVVRSYENRSQYGLKTIFTSNSCAAYRRTFFEQIDYFKNNLIFGEDTEAVARLLQKGHKVAYVAEAKVYHSHNYTYQEEFRRSFDIGVLHTSEFWLLDTYGHAEGIGRQFVVRQMTDLLKKRQIALFCDVVVRNGCKYLGYAFGRKYTTLPKTVIVKCSMYSSWWNDK